MSGTQTQPGALPSFAWMARALTGLHAHCFNDTQTEMLALSDKEHRQAVKMLKKEHSQIMARRNKEHRTGPLRWKRMPSFVCLPLQRFHEESHTHIRTHS